MSRVRAQKRVAVRRATARRAGKRTAARSAARAVPRIVVRPCPVVGIGASAGGLEALQELFGSLDPRTGMAYVVVSHLSPDHESLLSEILARATKMPVTQAVHGVQIEPDRVYVIPPNRALTVRGDRLRLASRADDGERFLPVDRFFASLAESCGSRAIGVVLSGTASDGAEGVRAIKSTGGITFAQDEATAKHPEMPRRAAASGAVDFVLPPASIARELSRLHRHAFVIDPAHEEVPDDDAPHLGRIVETLRRETGTDLHGYKRNTIRRRILRRMAISKIESLGDYADRVASDRAEMDALQRDVLINVTSFFRDGVSFRVLSKRVLEPLLRRRAKEGRFRAWVPGCSTGEEVYSIAASVLEALGEGRRNLQIQIFGTDVSAAVVDRARLGRYPETISADVSPERLRRFFVRTTDGYQVNKSLREACIFARHDLLKDPPFSKIDLVSCRNVLIYFDAALQRHALSLFHYALRPDGYLLLGSAEHAGRTGELFTVFDKKHKIYARRPVPARLHFGGAGDLGLSPAADVRPRSEPAHGPSAGETWKEVDRIVMSRYVPAGVVVDGEMEVLQFRGHTGPYLEPHTGAASLNLLRMAREGLVPALRTALRDARGGATVRTDRVRMRDDGHFVDVSLEVIPFTPRGGTEPLYLVLFDAGPASRTATDRRRGTKTSTSKRQGKKSVAHELAMTKDYLQTVIQEQEATNEELMSANEEILSSNEELQSTNEELETAKEELQSSNEELSTLNDELNNRNDALHDVNNDLAMLLSSLHMPMVILGSDLRVRRATPLGERMMNLGPGDVGRLITDVRPNVEVPDLPGVVREVVETLSPKDLEVKDAQGRWWAMRARPYKSKDHVIDGVVLTWVDAEGARRGGRRAARGVAAALLDLSPLPAALLGPDLRVDASNPGWRELFPDPHREAPPGWGDAEFTAALRQLVAGGVPFERRSVMAPNAQGKDRRLEVSARAVPIEPGEVTLLLVVNASP